VNKGETRKGRGISTSEVERFVSPHHKHLPLQPSLRGRALKQEINLPVARRLVLVRTASQLLKLPTGRGLKDSL
jgi:hypothetical protein